MRGFLFLGLGAFAAGAAAAVVMDRRSRVDDAYGEDPAWPAVPYTAGTHPDSPQERITADAPPAPAAATDGAEATEAESATLSTSERSGDEAASSASDA